MNTGDHNLIKSLNRCIIIEKIIENGSISRARLSKITGLNKATITSQISELLNDEIVIETNFDKSTGGRKPILLTLNRKAAYAIGIELDEQRIRFLLTDLKGRVITRCAVNMNTSSYKDTVKVLKETIHTLADNAPSSKYGIIGISIGIHGIVDKNEKIIFATHSKWRNVDLKSDLADEFQMPIYIDNNTNLCAYAEKTFAVDDPNVLCLTITSGIGLGIIIDNVVFKGYNGFAGEIGHMITNKQGEKCSCGNVGCWELYSSEKAFLKMLAARKDTGSCTLEQVKEWIEQKDHITLALLSEFSESLGVGINNVINIFNPETIIINSELISIYPRIIDNIKASLTSSMNSYKRILCSALGKDACALGASAFAIKSFLNISGLKLMKDYNK